VAVITLTQSTVSRPSLATSSPATFLDASPPPGAPAAGYHPIRRVSLGFPDPTLVDGVPVDWHPTSDVRADVGYLHVYIDGVDRSVFRGAPTFVDSWTLQDPFGCGPATIRFPRVTGFEQIGSGATGFLRRGASVDIYLVTTAGVRQQPPLWSGEIVKRNTTSSGTGTTFECVGDLQGPADLAVHKPAQYVPETDRGTLISQALDREVMTRRTAAIAAVATGHLTAGRGSSDQSVMAYVQSIMPLGWTVRRKAARRSYEIHQRVSGTIWTVRYGQPGVDLELSEDLTEAPNVIFGRGIRSDGYAWANWKYPGQIASQPPFPNTSASNVIGPGETDADTDSGDGVTQIQERINDLNLTGNVRVTGVYDAATEAAIRDIQDATGISVDGTVAGQTWNALWPLYSSVQIGKEVRLPLAVDPRVQPSLYAVDGTVTGANPSYTPTILRVERDENFGSGISKSVGIASAKAEYANTRRGGEAYPGWVGDVQLRVDPVEGSRYRIREADVLRVRSFQGGTIDLHIAQLRAQPTSGPGTVDLTVDELARDLPTVAAIIRQDEDSKDDPLRLPGRRARRSQVTPDAVEPFDGESSAGRIPRIPLFGGLWTVQAIPLSAAGKVARITFQASPVTAFYIALFGDVVTAEQLVRYVGDPTATDEYGRGPYQPNQDKLAELGFIDAVGGPFQASGYSPGQQTSPWDGFSESPKTGKLDSQAPISYRSVRPPWIWVAFYAESSCFIRGTILPGPIED
jgi:peptidoglycan hydrolase-like protein with peptidoglycan-binding domain